MQEYVRQDEKPGPKPGSEGARRIAEAHRGSHDHDKTGGFAANPDLAREVGRKGGETVKQRYGPDYYKEIGRKGGEALRDRRNPEYFATLGRKGGRVRAEKITAAQNAL